MILVSVSTFVCIAFGVMAIYWLMFKPASATAARVRRRIIFLGPTGREDRPTGPCSGPERAA